VRLHDLIAVVISLIAAVSLTGVSRANEHTSGFDYAIRLATDLPGHDYRKETLPNVDQCIATCTSDPACKSFTFNVERSVCFLKDRLGKELPFGAAISGWKQPSGADAGDQRHIFGIFKDSDFPGGDIRSGLVDPALRDLSLGQCQAICDQDVDCQSFTYNMPKQVCFLKDGSAKPEVFAGATSAVKIAPLPDTSVVDGLPTADLEWRDEDTETTFVKRIVEASQSFGAACKAERVELARLATELEAAIPDDPMKAGESVEVVWRRPASTISSPSWLMVSANRPVRFMGSGFYSLTPNAIAPFGISAHDDLTRAFVSLRGDDAPYSGSIEVVALEAGELTITVNVVGYVRRCLEEFSSATLERSLQVVVSPQAIFTVRDLFSFERPKTVIASPDGRTITEVFEGRIRLQVADRSAVLADRVGDEPRYSPTGRFLVVSNPDGGDLIDTVDGTFIKTLMSSSVAWENSDSFAIAAGIWGSVDGHNTLVQDYVVGFETMDPQAPALPLDCHACPGEFSLHSIDLENDVAFASGSFASFARRLSGARQLEDDTADGLEKQISSLLPRFGPSSPVLIPHADRPWHLRGGFKTTNTSSGLGSLAPNDTTDVFQRFERYKVEPIEVVLTDDSLVLGNSELGVTRGASALPTDPHLPTLDAEIAKRAMVSRLREFGLPLLEHKPATFTSDGRDMEEVLSRLEASVRFKDSSPFPETSCGRIKSESGGVVEWPEISQAVQFVVPQGTIWFLYSACSLGSSAAYYADLFVVVTQDTSQVFRLNQGEGGSTSEFGECGEFDIETCELGVRAYDNRFLLIWSKWAGDVTVFDTLNGKAIFTAYGNLQRANSFEEAFYAPETNHLIQVNRDNSFFLFDVRSGSQTLEGRYVDDEVVVWTPDLRFDASQEGASYVTLRFPGRYQQQSFQQYAKKLKAVGLIQSALRRQLTARPATALPIPPTIDGEVELVGGRLQGVLKASEGTAQISVFQDGLMTDILEVNDGTEIAVNVMWRDQTTWVSFVATDKMGLVSVPVGKQITAVGDLLPTVRAVVVAIDRYDTVGDLSFAGRDAATLESALRTQSGRSLDLASFKALVDEHATRESVLAELRAVVTSARPGETILFSFAGHGLLDHNGRFYMATSASNLSDIAGTSIAWDDVANVIAQTSARVVVLLDACHSGAAGTTAFASNDDAVADVLGNGSTGLLILSASKGRQLSEESAAVGGGYFTNAFADVISRKRTTYDINGNGRIEVSELYSGLKRSVALQTQGRQIPWLARNELVGDFPLF
jgi:hypothetical protein